MSTSKVTAALIIAVIAFAVQQTSIVPAIHDVQQALRASQEWASWLVTVYLMVATVATPAMGRLADLYGRRRMLLIGLARRLRPSARPTASDDTPLAVAAGTLSTSLRGQVAVVDAFGAYRGVLTARALADALADGQHDQARVATITETGSPPSPRPSTR